MKSTPAQNEMVHSSSHNERSNLKKGKTLDDLSSDLLHCIADYLPKYSSAILTVTNKKLFHNIGRKYLEAINVIPSVSLYGDPTFGPAPYRPRGWRETDEPPPHRVGDDLERETFLRLLDKDNANTIYCYHCAMIHNPEKTIQDLGKPFGDMRPCSRAIVEDGSDHYSHLYFSYSQAQSIMKKTLDFGIDCTTELKRLSNTSTTYQKLRTQQMSTVCKIVEGRFLLRVQYRFLLPLYGDESVESGHCLPVQVCPHKKIWIGRGPGIFGLFNCIQDYDHDSEECNTCLCALSCKSCATGYQIGFQMMEDEAVVIVCTVWRDFGNVDSARCPDWEAQNFRQPREKRGWENCGWSVRGRFGDSSGFALVDDQDSAAVNALHLVPENPPFGKSWRDIDTKHEGMEDEDETRDDEDNGMDDEDESIDIEDGDTDDGEESMVSLGGEEMSTDDEDEITGDEEEEAEEREGKRPLLGVFR